ncbi:MAG: hypothetical protein WCG97_02010 [bacterium]
MFKKILAASVLFLSVFTFGIVSAQNDVTSKPPEFSASQKLTGIPPGFENADMSKVKIPEQKLPADFPKNTVQSKYSLKDSPDVSSTTPIFIPKDVVTHSSIGVSDIRLDMATYQAGETLTGTVALDNQSTTDQTDVYLDISLAGNYSKEQGKVGLPDTTYDVKSSGPFNAKAGSKTVVHFSYVLPKSVGGKGLGIEINARSVSGLPYGWTNVMLNEVTGGKDLLSIKESYTILNGVKHFAESGPMIGATSTVSFHLVVSNPTGQAVTVIPSIEIRDRLSSGKLIKQYSDKSFTIDQKSTHEFSIDPYKNDNAPGVYVADVTLLDSEGDPRASSAEFRYIMPGAIATIHEVKFDQQSVAKDDEIKFEVQYSGAPHDMITGDRQKITGAVLNVQVQDAKTGEVLGESSAPADLSQESGTLPIYVQVKGSAESIRTISTISVDGKILSTYSTSPTEPDIAKNNQTQTDQSQDVYMIILAAIIGVGLVVLFYYFRRTPKKRNILMMILILLTVVSGVIIHEKNTSAYIVYNNHATWGNSMWCPWVLVPEGYYGRYHVPAHYAQQIPCSYADASWNTITIESPATNATTFAAGTNVVVSGYVASIGCGNTPENLTIYVSIRNTASHDVTPVYTAYHYNRNHPGTEYGGSPTLYDRFAFSIPQTLPKGNYYVSVTTYEDWVGNGLWEHAGWLTDYTPIQIIPGVSVSCVADKTTAKIGEAVTWNMTPSGGSGSYTYFWEGTDQHTYPAAAPQKASLTKTYTAKGLKDMKVAIIDKYSGSNSAVNNGGPWNKCNTVNVTDDVQGGPLTQSCTPSSATVAINQPVTWTINKSGGYAPYTYDLGDASGHVSSGTITRTYTTLGTKTMNYSLADASSALPVPIQACPSVNVVANLTCNLAGKIVANGSVTRLYAEETANCGNYTDFTCSNGTLSAGDQTVYKNARCVDASGPASISSFLINPDTVNKNESCTMSLKVDNAQSCIITGNNGDSINVGLDSLGSASTTKQSKGLLVTSMYTLTCSNKTKDAAGNFPTVSKTQKCYLNADSFEK